jgi:thioredoxin-dependent peroxiredoxin
MLEPGDRFPVEKLSTPPDGPAVVFFYPAALTPGCTMEAKGFNDRYQRFRDAGYEVVGVSVDTADKNDEFRSECGLDFPLVSDTDTTLTTELGLMKEYGEFGTFARRVTYLLDGDGVVRQVWDVQNAAEHPQEVLAAVESAES